MKTLKALVLFLAAAMFIVACGTTDPDNGNGNGNDDPTTGTLTVNVTDSGGDPLTATIAVTDSDGDVVDTQTDSSFTWTVDPGDYTVNVSASGYQSATQPATITAGSTTSLAFQLVAVDPSVTTGTLFVSVSDGVAPVEGTIVVTDADGDVVDTQTDTSFTWPDVPAGTYTVTVDADGYQQFSDSADIVAGETTQVFVVLLADDAVLVNVANVSIVGFVDEDGNPYDTNDEINPVVSKLHVAAQTEEMVGVQVLVTDADGEPVANAPVTVSITGDFGSTLAIYAGSPVEVMASSTQTFQGLMTDADGMVYFTIEATNDFATGDFFRDGFGEPVKLIVSSVGGNNVAKRTEFKSWFVNMSHLWYGETDDGDFIYDDDENPILIYTENRLGADLGTFINVWDTAGDNAHTFFTYALTKQPTFGPFAVGGQFFYRDNGIMVPLVSQAGPGFGWGFPGYMRYTLTDWSTDDAGNRLVEWDASLCDDMTPDGLTCISYGWDGGSEEVALVPAAGVKLEDLPIEATVHATYVYEAPYGQEVYEFELKDYTFTKQWVGGFLTIDKYVDQHVLTWKGQDITRVAFLTNEDDIWTSTIYVTIENPSDSPLYNVTIRDVVPAELGVVTTSISDDGTYDEVNHAVTWNNVTTPGLAVVNPGDVFTFSFDVYARQKPGYCWQLNADETFAYFGDVPPLVDPTLEPNACAYNDPYLVQNGAPYRDVSGNLLNGVTVAGFLEDGVAGEQLVFAYNPAVDESDIWIVRPFLRLTKDLVSANVMNVGAAASYRIDARQIDRVDRDDDPGSTEYAFLYDRYPWEFRADLADAPADWHIANESQVRDNPYARDVQVSDAFEYALDFTQGIDFDGSVFAGGQRVVGKVVNFNAIPSLPRGTLETARLALTANLPSDDGTVTSQNGAIRQLAADPALYAWNNCAYLGAPQLNQPHPGSNTFADTFYSGTYPTFPGDSDLWVGPDEPWRAFDTNVEDFANRQVQWHQVDNLDNLDWRPATNLVTGFDGTAPVLGFPAFGPPPTSPVDRLEYCALVAVIPPPPTPLMTLTTNGEVNVAPIDGVFLPQNLDDGFEVGDVFWYVVTAKNAGLETAEDVLITVTLNGPQVRFDGTGELRLGDPETWGLVLENPAFNNDTTHTFAATDVPAGQSIRLILPARANQVGRVDMTTTLDYSNPPAGESLPLEVQEETTVQ